MKAAQWISILQCKNNAISMSELHPSIAAAFEEYKRKSVTEGYSTTLSESNSAALGYSTDASESKKAS